MELSSKSWDLLVDDRIRVIEDALKQSQIFSYYDAPGLKDLLDQYSDPDVEVNSIKWRRQMLQVFKDSKSDNKYQELLDECTKDEQERISKFVSGEDPAELCKGFVMGPSMGCRHHLQKMRESTSNFRVSSSGITPSLVAPEKDSWFHRTVLAIEQFIKGHHEKTGRIGSVVVIENAEFQNWGRTVKNTPRITCVCKSVLDVETIVGFAKSENMSVRCAGYRHSWAPLFGRTGEILISFLDLPTAEDLPNFTSLAIDNPELTELEVIEEVAGEPLLYPNGSLVRVGCATTNERLRRWCVANKKLTIPLNVVMVEITLGGSNGAICHGAGRRHRTLSDLVRKVEYVDANGKLQIVDDPKHLRAASGCFGLLGVITHLTLEFPPMTYAKLDPIKMPVIQAVPPPADLDEKEIPPALLSYWKDLTPESKQKFQEDFERRATNDYYNEWFWFPYSDYAFVNTWNDTEDPEGAIDFPDEETIFLSFIQTFTLNVMQYSDLLTSLQSITGVTETAVTLLSRTAMYALPEEPVKTYVPDGLHFQRAIQNIRVRNMEVEMPLVAKSGGRTNEIDFAPIQRAWWDAILLAYANNRECPMRFPLEMRMMGDSDVIMAAQRGNKLGTCSIEILTLQNAVDIWPQFAQKVLDKWMALKDPNTGERLRTRPHWAKEWHGFNVDGRPWFERLKNEDYKQEIAEFLAVLADIGKGAGWTLKDLQARFSNELFDDLVFDMVKN